RNPLFRQVVAGEAGENGDTQELEVTRPFSLPCGPQRLPVDGMHGEEIDPEPGDISDGLLDRVSDVQELHVEKDELARAAQLLSEPQAAIEQQLEADLVKVNSVPKFFHDSGGF